MTPQRVSTPPAKTEREPPKLEPEPKFKTTCAPRPISQAPPELDALPQEPYADATTDLFDFLSPYL